MGACGEGQKREIKGRILGDNDSGVGATREIRRSIGRISLDRWGLKDHIVGDAGELCDVCLELDAGDLQRFRIRQVLLQRLNLNCADFGDCSS